MKKLSNLEKNFHDQFVRYGRNAKEWMRKCILLLPKIEEYRIWEKKGFSSIYEYAAKLAGMSHNTVDDVLRILKKIEDKPELIKVVQEKGINSVRPIVTIATKENASFLADKARVMSVNTLRLYKREFCGPSWNVPEINPKKVTISMQLDSKIAQQLEKLKGQDDWNKLMKQFLEMRKEQLEAQKTESIKANSRHIPAKIKKYVLKRANYKCEFKNCKESYEILHHTDRFALKREHNPAKIVALCREHERIVHLGLIKNEHDPPQLWQIRTEADKYDIKYMIDQRVAECRAGNLKN